MRSGEILKEFLRGGKLKISIGVFGDFWYKVEKSPSFERFVENQRSVEQEEEVGKKRLRENEEYRVFELHLCHHEYRVYKIHKNFFAIFEI